MALYRRVDGRCICAGSVYGPGHDHASGGTMLVHFGVVYLAIGPSTRTLKSNLQPARGTELQPSHLVHTYAGHWQLAAYGRACMVRFIIHYIKYDLTLTAQRT